MAAVEAPDVHTLVCKMHTLEEVDMGSSRDRRGSKEYVDVRSSYLPCTLCWNERMDGVKEGRRG
jgi:hypothetical protein